MLDITQQNALEYGFSGIEYSKTNDTICYHIDLYNSRAHVYTWAWINTGVQHSKANKYLAVYNAECADKNVWSKIIYRNIHPGFCMGIQYVKSWSMWGQKRRMSNCQFFIMELPSGKQVNLESGRGEWWILFRVKQQLTLKQQAFWWIRCLEIFFSRWKRI